MSSDSKNAVHVPKNTRTWRVPIPQENHGRGYFPHPENMRFEDVKLLLCEDGIKRGYSKTLGMWIIADDGVQKQVTQC